MSESEFSVKTASFLNVFITTSCEDRSIERRFFKGITIADLKGKLEIVTGANQATMQLKVYDKTDKFICALDDDEALLGSYHVDDGMKIHVEDSFELRKQLDYEIDAEVHKFELSNEDYSKRADSVQAYLKLNKLGKYSDSENEKRENEKKAEDELEKERLELIKIDSRCQVTTPGQPIRRAVVRYIGKVNFSAGTWIGVEFDEPTGKNDGSVQGVRYFQCSPKYGGFVKPIYVEVGDFPKEDIDLEDEL